MAQSDSNGSDSSEPVVRSVRPFCRNLARPVPKLHPTVHANPRRASAILSMKSKWVNGTVLHYCFFTTGHYAVPKAQADAIRQAFATWKAVGIGLEFKEVENLGEAEVRIGYSLEDAASASAVGREVLDVPKTDPTTVYGWDLTTPYGQGTALHELGHVLGMEHEHQNPFAGIKWKDDVVYASLAKPPNNWDRDTTFHNILEKLTPEQVQGSTWDPDSIMEYEFEPGLIEEPKEYGQRGLYPPGKLSKGDQDWAFKWYPPLTPTVQTLKPSETATIELTSGQQIDYIVTPTESRKYRIETKGASDAVLVLFEEVDGVPSYLTGDDDSGEDKNAVIEYKLFSGRKYIVRLRVYYPGQTGQTSLTIL